MVVKTLKIDSVNVPVDEVEDRLRDVGITGLVAGMNLPYKKENEEIDKYSKRFRTAVKRGLFGKTKDYGFMLDALETLLPGFEMSDVLTETEERLLRGVSKSGDRFVKMRHETVSKSWFLTNLNGEIKDSCHGTRRYYKDTEMVPILVNDFKSLVSELVMKRSLIDYAKAHWDIRSSLFAQLLINEIGYVYLDLIPEKYQQVFIEDMERLNLDHYIIRDSVGGYNAYSTFGLTQMFDDYYSGTFDIDSLIGYEYVFTFYKLQLFIDRFLSDFGNVRFELKQEYNDKKEYARAFETKSSIKKSHLKVMEETKFKSVFEFVELDNSVDLEKFSVIENELDRVFEILPRDFASDHSFRVKKLGKHKSLGLYFRGEKALLVDVSSPASFVHEYFHLLDYSVDVEGRLSDREEFSILYDMYKREVTHAVSGLDDSNPFKVIWESKNMHNREYYLSKREAFARMGEVYFGRKLGKDISLAKSFSELQESVVHVTTEEFVNNIVEVFDGFLQNR